MKTRDFLIVPAATLAVMVLNVAISIVVVWVYATFVEPGRPYSDYEAFAERAAPVSSVVAGIPLMLLAGWLVARGRDRRGALTAAGAVALLYIAIDSAIVAAAGVAASVWALVALSHATKLLAALAGATFAARPNAP